MKILNLLGGLLKGGIPNFTPIVNACYEEVKYGFILFAIIGLLLAVITLFIINSVKKLQPQKMKFKIFNFLNFIYLPLLFALSLGGFGALHFAEKYIVKQIPETVTPATQLAFPAFQFYIKTNWKHLKEKNADLETAINGFNGFVKLSPASDSWLETKKIETANSEIPKMISFGLEAVVEENLKLPANSEKTKLEVAKTLNTIRLKEADWVKIGGRIANKTHTNYNHKRLSWSVMILLFSSLLLLEFAFLLFDKK